MPRGEPADPTDGRVAILAGGGGFPAEVARLLGARGARPFVVGIAGEADFASLAGFDTASVKIGQLGRFFRLVAGAGARRLLIIGSIGRRRLPRPWECDLAGLVFVLGHLGLLRSGDDSVLRRVARLMEAGGLEVVGVADVAPELLAPVGPLGHRAPDAADLADVAAARAAALALGRADKGQGAVAAGGRVIATEAIDGTDAMLARLAAARAASGEGGGVLVKVVKPHQDRRLDLPAIGLRTLEAAAAARLSGIAVEAGGAILMDRAVIGAEADRRGLFVLGLDRDGRAPAAP